VYHTGGTLARKGSLPRRAGVLCFLMVKLTGIQTGIIMSGMKKKKITTIEDLAVLMQNEFLSIQERFDGVDGRFDQVDEQFDEMKEEIKELRRDIEDLKLRTGEMVFRFEIKEIEKRLRKLELKLG